jgi:hypothetical protein
MASLLYEEGGFFVFCLFVYGFICLWCFALWVGGAKLSWVRDKIGASVSTCPGMLSLKQSPFTFATKGFLGCLDFVMHLKQTLGRSERPSPWKGGRPFAAGQNLCHLLHPSPRTSEDLFSGHSSPLPPFQGDGRSGV